MLAVGAPPLPPPRPPPRPRPTHFKYSMFAAVKPELTICQK